MESSVSTSKILCDLNEEFHQYEPPANKIPFDVDNKYNVFLSFRGKDVRTTFVDHLYEALSGAGLRVFLDSEELGKGKEIESSLKIAIYCCTNLRGLPNSVGNLRQLKMLKLIDCTGIKSLPSSVGNLGQLEVLNLRGCSGLRNLPNTIGDLVKLHYLFIRGCSGLQSLHCPLDKLQNLRRLCITTPAHPESFHNWVSELSQRRKLNRSVGLGSLVEKKFNVYFVYHTADEREILMGDKYKYLRTGSLCVCRDSEYNASSDIREAFGSSDILVPVFSKNFVSSIVCMKNYVAMNYSSGLVIPLVLRTYTWPYCYKYLKTMRKLNYQSI